MNNFEELKDYLIKQFEKLPETKYRFIDHGLGLDLYYILDGIYYPFIKIWQFHKEQNITYEKLQIVQGIFKEATTFLNFKKFTTLQEINPNQENFISNVMDDITQSVDKIEKLYKEFTIKKEIELINNDLL